MYGLLGFGLRISIYLLGAGRKAKWPRRGIPHNEVGEFAEDTTFQVTGGLKSKRRTPEEPIKNRPLRNLLMNGIQQQPTRTSQNCLQSPREGHMKGPQPHLSSACIGLSEDSYELSRTWDSESFLCGPTSPRQSACIPLTHTQVQGEGGHPSR